MWGVSMTIEMLNRGIILVSLADEDMQLYSLRFDNDDPDQSVKKGLRSLLYRVGEVCGLDHRGKSYLVEVLPARDGCLLVISVRRTAGRRMYRVKRTRTRPACLFDRTDDLLDWLCLDRSLGYAVYACSGGYLLLPEPAAPKAALAELSEYGRLTKIDPVALARVREHGSLICERRPLRYASKYSSSAAM